VTQESVDRPEPVQLYDVRSLGNRPEQVIEAFIADQQSVLRGLRVEHIGATAMPSGHTKADVDVNLRVDASQFAEVVERLRHTCRVAQPENWMPSFASFACDQYELPLGIQVTVLNSENDFLTHLRDRMLADADLLRRYDECKVGAAPYGAAAYWKAKDAFLSAVLVTRQEGA
jgi:GrpB-like predicted nucleotidyltransferase (UPF0157 family)